MKSQQPAFIYEV